MKLTTLSRYGVRCLFDIAYYGAGESVRASQISRRQKISLNYIGQILLRLKRAELVKSKRGRSGGYTLALPPEEINLLTIMEAVEGPLCFIYCLKDNKSCQLMDKCVTHDIWNEACNLMKNYFSKKTVLDLIRMAEARNIKRG